MYFLTSVASLVNNVNDGGSGVAIASGDSFAILIVSAWVEIGGGVATVSACVENEGTCVAIVMVSASDCDDLASLLGCLLARCLLSVCLLSGCLLWYPQQPAERYQYLCLALNALTE